MLVLRGEKLALKPYFYAFVARYLYPDLWNYKSSIHMQTHLSRNQCKHQQLCVNFLLRPILLRRRSEKYIVESSKDAHWIGLYLSFHLNWVLGPFVHATLQIPQTSEVTFAHVITPLMF